MSELTIWHIIVLYVLLFFFFLPTIVAVQRGHQSGAAIFLLNFFLGLTVLGWFIALLWAFSAKTQPVVIVNNITQMMPESNEARLLSATPVPVSYDEEHPQRSHPRWVEETDRKIFDPKW